MKTTSTNQSIPHRNAAFTLAETLIASSIFVMLMGSLVYTFLFGLHLHETTATKLGASDNARKALIHLTDEIRSAATIKIGSGVDKRDYSTLSVRAGDLFGDAQRIGAFEWALQATRPGKEVDRDEWAESPQVVNDYENPVLNVWLPVTYDMAPRNEYVLYGLSRSVPPQ